jgi:hypothetical protein
MLFDFFLKKRVREIFEEKKNIRWEHFELCEGEGCI